MRRFIAHLDANTFMKNQTSTKTSSTCTRRSFLERASLGVAAISLSPLVTGAKYPSSAVSLGGIYVWKDGREHPDTFQTVLEYPEGFLFDYAMDLGNATGSRFLLHGTEATLDIDNWTITPEGGTRDKKPEPRQIAAVPATGHMQNWLECLRSRKLPAADIQIGQQQTVAVVMSALAFESGRRLRFDPDKTKIVTA
jgi:hypothetical protein